MTEELREADAVQEEQEEQEGEGGDGVVVVDCFWGFEMNWDEDFDEDKKLVASGSHCSAYRTKRGDVPVVLKVMKEGKIGQEAKSSSEDLDNELNFLQILSGKHPCICRLYGAGIAPNGGIFLVLEDLAGGTLDTMLGTGRRSGNTTVLDRWFTRTFYFPFRSAMEHAIQVAGALAFMHSEAMPVPIMHRDVKASNVAFSKDGTLKLFDFGLCKALRPRDVLMPAASTNECPTYRLTGGTGSLRYMAPEVYLNAGYNEKADVYSFGILLWEMVSLQRPFEYHTPKTMQSEVIMGTERPSLQASWPLSFQSLLRKCWSHSANERPTMIEVESILRSIHRDLP
jgi:serine/threonine protein kinase